MEKEKRATTIKRTITGVVGLPILAAVLLFANTIVMDIFTAAIARISMYEYYHCFKLCNKGNPTQILGYLFCILIVFTHFVDKFLLYSILSAVIPVSLIILSAQLVLSKGKKPINDLAI